jgi:hypothetical protein
LFNPDSAQRCDCGFDFESRTIQAPFVERSRRSGDDTAECAVAYAAFLLFGLVLLGMEVVGYVDPRLVERFVPLMIIGTLAAVVGILLTLFRLRHTRLLFLSAVSIAFAFLLGADIPSLGEAALILVLGLVTTLLPISWFVEAIRSRRHSRRRRESRRAAN